MGSKQRLRAERRMAAQTAEKQNLSVRFSVDDNPEDATGIEVDLDDTSSNEPSLDHGPEPDKTEVQAADGGGIEVDPQEGDDGEDPIEVLRRQYEEANAAREAAEKRAAEKEAAEVRYRADSERERLERERAEAKWREEEKKRSELEEFKVNAKRQELVHHKHTVDGEIDRVNTYLESVERTYIEALNNLDHASVVKAQREIARGEAYLRELANAQSNLSAQIEAPLPEPVVEPEPEPKQVAQTQPQPSSDPFEAFLATSNLLDADKAYLRSRKDFIQADPRNGQLLQSVANLAEIRHNLKPGTPEYHAFIDEQIGLAGDEETEDNPQPAPAPQNGRRPATQKRPAAAPGSRSTASGQGTKVFLSEWDLEQAKMLNMDPKDYAKFKVTSSEGQLTQAQTGGRLMARYTA